MANVWDEQSGVGKIPAQSVAEGHWVVLRLPAGHKPGVFSKPTTAERLRDLLGNPLLDEE